MTYDDENLIFADDEPCLYKRDLQLHFKRLRKHLEPRSFKYYAVGEYGDHGCRPHYHYLMFYRGKIDRFMLMQLIKDDWTKGFSKVLPVHGAQGYVTKYILKFDTRHHLVPTFSMISHGLGIDYLSDSVVAYHRKNLVGYAMKPGGYKITLPRYYKDKIFTTYQKLIIKKRSDMHRRDLELVRLANIDLQMDIGLNPFRASIERYQQRVYQSLNLYRQKKKL